MKYEDIKTTTQLQEEFKDIQFLSPNEPLTVNGVQRILNQMQGLTNALGRLTGYSASINLWDANMTYAKGDVVVYFKKESKRRSVEQGQREFVFLLMSLKDGNTNTPNYDIVDHIPDFTKSGWTLLNPLSYLLQDLNEMKTVVVEVFKGLLDKHVQEQHGLIGSEDIKNNLVRRDYANLQTPWEVGKYSLTNLKKDVSGIGWKGTMRQSTNGIMEYAITYGFDAEANQFDPGVVKIADSRYYHQKSPIWDEDDRTIFARKYTEDNLFSVVVNPDDNQGFNHLRYGTNIFWKKIELPTPFLDDEYCVFFDTYGPGSFVFGYDKAELEAQTEPTYDAVVSMPMLMNKTKNGFTIVLPVHTYFNSMQKYNIAVPWENKFRLQLVGRFR